MEKSIRNAAVLSALIVSVAAVGATPARADSGPAVYGIVERVPGTPDLVGEWSIGGQTVVVDGQTRLERHHTATAGYWIQAATGVVLHAPGWTADEARAAGFRPASAGDLATFRPGRLVKARVQPGPDGRSRVTKLELEHEPR